MTDDRHDDPVQGPFDGFAAGVDPARIFGGLSARQSRREDHKLRQLCRQVRDTLQDALATEFDDPMVRDLLVLDVQPAPHAGRLCVVLEHSWPDEHFDAQIAQERLNALKGLMRAQVAQAIHRRRTPELTFCVLAPGEVKS